MSLFEILWKRLLIGAATLLFVSVLVFLGTEILPGDVAQAILGQGATPELVAQIPRTAGSERTFAHSLSSMAWQFL